MIWKTLNIDGEDFSDIVQYNSYKTAIIPVMDSITTISGVDHVVHIRNRGSMSFVPNPINQSRYTEFCNKISSGICNVEYTCLQTGADVTQTMRVEGISSNLIGSCRYLGKDWVRVGEVVFTEL